MENSNENKINDYENKDANSKTIIDKDKTFNKLKEIQSLLKKESSLSDLCKKIIEI